ncbi:MAG: response regulator [Elusimicrobia bacterium]|nr:response regulator [Elusimicrobiota bacterium]
MSKKVLVVDDDTHTNDLVSETLKLEGYEVVQVGSGEEALALLETTSVDLILLDLLLPGMRGWKLAEELKKNPKTKSIPIVVISILSPEDTEMGKENPSVIGYVCKPFDLNVLVQEVKKHAA